MADGWTYVCTNAQWTNNFPLFIQNKLPDYLTHFFIGINFFFTSSNVFEATGSITSSSLRILWRASPKYEPLCNASFKNPQNPTLHYEPSFLEILLEKFADADCKRKDSRKINFKFLFADLQ